MKINFRVVSIIVALLMMLPLASCSGEEFANEDDAREVMKIGSSTVYYDEFRYLYLNYKEQMDGGDPTYWTENPDREADILKYVNEALLSTYGTLELAKKYDVSLTAEDKKTVLATEESTIEQIGSEEAFLLALEGSYMSRRVFRSMVELDLIESKLFETLTNEMNNHIPSDDKTIEADIAENFIRIQQIVIINDIGDDEDANRAQADEILSTLRGGADFEELMSRFSEDEETNDPIAGYYFTRGEFDLLPGFDEIAYALDMGEISEVYEGATSYHILRRMPLEDEYINYHFEDLRDASVARRYYEFVDNASAELEVKTTELYSSLGLSTVS